MHTSVEGYRVLGARGTRPIRCENVPYTLSDVRSHRASEPDLATTAEQQSGTHAGFASRALDLLTKLCVRYSLYSLEYSRNRPGIFQLTKLCVRYSLYSLEYSGLQNFEIPLIF